MYMSLSYDAILFIVSQQKLQEWNMWAGTSNVKLICLLIGKCVCEINEKSLSCLGTTFLMRNCFIIYTRLFDGTLDMPFKHKIQNRAYSTLRSWSWLQFKSVSLVTYIPLKFHADAPYNVLSFWSIDTQRPIKCRKSEANINSSSTIIRYSWKLMKWSVYYVLIPSIPP